MIPLELLKFYFLKIFFKKIKKPDKKNKMISNLQPSVTKGVCVNPQTHHRSTIKKKKTLFNLYLIFHYTI